jgi:hypothetical protein
MDYFKKEISSSGEPYFRNKVTNQTQWGFYTYENTNKRLPRGWVRLNVNGGKSFYKYNKPVSSYSYAYAPRELEEILKMSYEDLIDEDEEEQQAEISRRNNLFQKVARRLKLKTDSICDESLEFLAGKADVPIKGIITYIEETEREQLREKATLTPFSTIKRTDSSFSSKRSIRELCGLNMREVEAQNALSQIQHQFTCIISLYPFIDPVTCSSGHTFEREGVTRLIRSSNPVCPLTKLRLTGLISPNHALKNVIDQFVEKYKNQKGEHWVPILEFCTEYTKGSRKRLKDPIDVKKDFIPEIPIETARTPREILDYLLECGYNFYDIDNIPEVVASSEDSSYDHALNEVRRRLEDPEYREAHRARILIIPPEHEIGRSANEIRAFLLENGHDLDIIDNIPELVANSENSCFYHALTNVNFRLENRLYSETYRSRTAEELLEYYSSLVPRNAENLRRPEAYDVAVQTANNPLYNSYATACESPIGRRWFLLHM